MKAFCSNCKNPTNHTAVKEYDQNFSDEDHNFHANYVYQIIQCNGCESISFREVSQNSDEIDPEDGSPIETVKLYPQRGEGMLPLKGYYTIPTKIRSIYRETLDAFNNGMYILCSAGLRAIIESICNNEGIINGPVEVIKKGAKKIERRKDLQGKISGLHEKGILTQKHSTILHEHRYIGNEAVHALTQPSFDELKIAIEIIEHTIENLYEIANKADKLKRTKAMRNKGLL